ncbi:Kinase, NEK [Giardia lamblia P15]|uniref:Kinase, NEK n=1 Tax=Giardia intestinalis (strain P15) TaxID=658858 RepID=E1EY17_GIAIA|nr:Kinase, NEK [Giardia lamblia P15]
MDQISKHHADAQLIQMNAKETTYIARRLVDDTIVLVKDIDLHGLNSVDRDEILTFYDRFSSLDTESVVKIHRIWPKKENRLLVETEYLRGENLSALLNKHIEQQILIEEEEIWSIARSVADALAHLHSKFNPMGPLVYKFLRPENILIADGNVYKLCDCYCDDMPMNAVVDGTKQDLIHSTGNLYKAPEQMSSKIHTTKTDIWSFGFLLLHLCKPDLVVNQQNEPLNIQHINLSEYSINLTNMVNKCLLSDPHSRPSAAELVLHIRYLYQKNMICIKESTISNKSISAPLRIGFGRYNDWKTPGNLVQVMPRMGIEVDTPTPLMLAAEKGDVNQLTEYIAEAGKTDWQGTALIKAARKGHVECVSALLSELGIQSRRGWTALQDAAYSGQKACIPLLMLEACIQRPDGHTALMGAARNGHQDCVKLLRNREMRMTTTSGRTALMYAAENNHPQCVRLLLDEAGMQDISGNTALILAALEGNVECVALLAIYEVILPNAEGETVLQLLEKRLKCSRSPLSEKFNMCMDKLLMRESHS